MSLVVFLYRCPACGHDPLVGKGDRARCGACGTRFERGKRGQIRAGDSVRPARDLARAIEEFGGPLTAATAPDGSIRYTTRVEAVRCVAMDPIQGLNEFLGFAERWGEAVPGTLQATDAAVSFSPDGEGEGGHVSHLDLRAIQTASSALQLVTAAGLTQYRFLEDSVLRWESLLRTLVRRSWADAGRGEVAEFQPRIVALP